MLYFSPFAGRLRAGRDRGRAGCGESAVVWRASRDRGGRGARLHRAVLPALSRASERWAAVHARVGRGEPLLRRRVLVRHGVCRPSALGTRGAGVPEARRAALSRRRDPAARGDRAGAVLRAAQARRRLAQRPAPRGWKQRASLALGDPGGAACGRVRRGARRPASHDRPRCDRAPRQRRDAAPRARRAARRGRCSRCSPDARARLRGVRVAAAARGWSQRSPRCGCRSGRRRRRWDGRSIWRRRIASSTTLVPGFDGVRVPARFWMVGLLALSVLGGIGAARLARTRRGLAVLGLVVALLCLAEARIDPFVVNGAGPVAGFNAPEPRLRRRDDAPAVYEAVARQPAGAVLAELPLGLPDFDLRAMYYSTFHWRQARERLQRLHAGALRAPGRRARPHDGVGRRGVGGARDVGRQHRPRPRRRPTRTREAHA